MMLLLLGYFQTTPQQHIVLLLLGYFQTTHQQHIVLLFWDAITNQQYQPNTCCASS